MAATGARIPPTACSPALTSEPQPSVSGGMLRSRAANPGSMGGTMARSMPAAQPTTSYAAAATVLQVLFDPCTQAVATPSAVAARPAMVRNPVVTSEPQPSVSGGMLKSRAANPGSMGGTTARSMPAAQPTTSYATAATVLQVLFDPCTQPVARPSAVDTNERARAR